MKVTWKLKKTKRIIGNLRKILTTWKNSEYISNTTHKTLISSDGLLPKAYGLSKVHIIVLLELSFPRWTAYYMHLPLSYKK